MEKAIVYAWNQSLNPPQGFVSSKDKAYFANPKYNEGAMGEEAQEVVDFLRGKIPPNVTAQHRLEARPSVTSSWTTAGGGKNNEPKTDLMIGDYRISLKKSGGSQLVSSKQGDTSALVATALDQLIQNGELSSERGEIEAAIMKMGDFKVHNTKRELLKGKTANDEDVLPDILELENDVHKKLDRIMKDLFKKDIFKNHLVFEAATGSRKFGAKSTSTSDWLLVFGGHIKWHPMKNPNDIGFLTKSTSVRVAWKSSKNEKTGIRSLYSSLRVDVKEALREYEGLSLNENMLTNIYNKIKNLVSRAWNKVKKWVFATANNFMQFFGIEIQDVSVMTKF